MSGHGPKFTPGPWTREDLYVKSQDYRVATVHVGTSGRFGNEEDALEESFADADLITAAPDLYQAGEALLVEINHLVNIGANPVPSAGAVEKLRRALTRARGELW